MNLLPAMRAARTASSASAFFTRVLAALALDFFLVTPVAGCRPAPIRWSPAVDWQPYEAGLTQAKAEGKPVMLTFFADWCEPCRAFHPVLDDPRVIARARDFEMVRVNVDEREDLAGRYRLGGNTLPRTYFLMPDGTLLRGVHGGRLVQRFAFNGAGGAVDLLGAMDAALAYARDPSVPSGIDPSAPTPANVCATAPADDPCVACGKARCCDGLVAFFAHDDVQSLVPCAEPCGPVCQTKRAP